MDDSTNLSGSGIIDQSNPRFVFLFEATSTKTASTSTIGFGLSISFITLDI